MTDLRKLAEAATPGPWRTSWDDESYPPDGDPDPEQWLIRAGDESVVWMFFYDGEKLGCSAADARFIAACSPEAILALLDRAERAERERDEERHLATVRGEMLTALERERDAMDTTISTICLVDLDPYDGCRMPLVGPSTRENVVSRVATLEAAYRGHAQALADVREALLDAFPDANGSKVTTLAQVVRDLTDERDEAIEDRKAARDDAARAAAKLAVRTMERDEASAERDARPEITVEDAAGYLHDEDTDTYHQYGPRVRVEQALRTHAAKVTR